MFCETSPLPHCMAQEFAMLYVTYRGAVVGLRGAVVGNNVIPTYVISRGAVVRQPFWLLGYRGISSAFVIVHVYTCKLIML